MSFTLTSDDAVFERAHFVYSQDPEFMRDIAHIKRFLERYSGDHQFRTQVLSGLLSLEDAARDCGCALDVSSLRPIFHPAFLQYRAQATLADWPLAFKWDLFFREMLGVRDSLHAVGDSGGVTPWFDQWRQRNMARSQFELGMTAQGIVHPAMAIELSSGCSVGCWFCGISAKKFGGHFSIENGGEAEWTAVLQAAHAILGRGMKTGFCYWATDPLDNPDYLRFLEIYNDIVGIFPQTTTAIPLRNVELTRGVMAFWERKRGIPNRFSVLSTGVLKRIHETFTPEELLGVEMVLQNKKSDGVIKFKAGRSAAKADADAASAQAKGDVSTDAKPSEETLADGTIACVTGFLLNVVERTVRLVSPTMPSTLWPDGYIVYDHQTYTTPEDLGRIMSGMVERHMKPTLTAREPVGFSDGITFTASTDGGAVIASKWTRVQSHDFDLVGPLLASATLTPLEIVSRVAGGEHGVMKVVAILESLWNAGLIRHPLPGVSPAHGRSELAQAA